MLTESDGGQAQRLSDLFRAQRSPTDAYVLSRDGTSITPASPGLTADLNADLDNKRQRMLSQFGVDRPDFLPPEHDRAIAQHFGEKGHTIAPICMVDPKTDAQEIRRIYMGGFSAPDSADILAGTASTEASPAGSRTLDVVVLHDWRQRYRERVTDYLGERHWKMSDAEVDRMVSLRGVDLVAHEEGHLTPGQQPELVLKKDSESPAGYSLTHHSALAFRDPDGIFPASLLPEHGDEHFNGAAFDEGIAARHSAEVVSSLTDFVPKAETANPERNFLVYGRARAGIPVWVPGKGTVEMPGPRRSPAWICLGVHSMVAGAALNGLVEKVPQVGMALEAYESGRTDYPGFIETAKEHLPLNILRLGHAPTSRAWDELKQAVDEL
jgi:hypothetical protein